MRKLIVCWCLLLCACEPSIQQLRLGVTTTQEDSGLLKTIITAFEQEHPIKILPVVAGSGKLFSLIRRGEIDIAITHDPEGEQILLKQGLIQHRLPLFYNFFVLVGPVDNPANIHYTDSLPEVFNKLLQPEITLVSRGDNSGTHKAEQAIWQSVLANQPLPESIQTGAGMGLTLNVAVEKQAYTLVDWGTWLHFNNKQNMQLLWPRIPSRLSRQQTLSKSHPLLHNPYSLLIIQPDSAAATVFQQWLIDKGRKLVSQYKVNHQTVFFIEN